MSRLQHSINVASSSICLQKDPRTQLTPIWSIFGHLRPMEAAATCRNSQWSMVSSKPHRIFGRNSLMTFPKRSSKELLPIVHGYFFKTLYQPEMLGHFGIVSNMYSDGRSIFYPDYHESSLFLPMKPTVKNS